MFSGGFEYDQRKIPAKHSTSPMIVHIPPSPTHCDLSDSVESIQVINITKLVFNNFNWGFFYVCGVCVKQWLQTFLHHGIHKSNVELP